MIDGINFEIGARTNPIIETLDPKFTQGRKSILIDKRFWGDWGIYPQLHRQAGYVQSNSQALPFTDKSAELLVSKNLFSAHNQDTNDPNINTQKEDVGDFGEIAKEWYRVAKPGAFAIIIETAALDESLLNNTDHAFLNAGFKRTADDLYKQGDIVKLFNLSKLEAHYKREIYNSKDLLHAFAVIYTKPSV